MHFQKITPKFTALFQAPPNICIWFFFNLYLCIHLYFNLRNTEDASLLVKWIRFRCTLRRLRPSLQLYSRLAPTALFPRVYNWQPSQLGWEGVAQPGWQGYMCVGANADINSNTNTDIITNLDEQKWIQVFWSNLQSSYGEKGDLLDFGSKHWPLGCYWCTTQIIFVLYQFLSQ